MGFSIRSIDVDYFADFEHLFRLPFFGYSFVRGGDEETDGTKNEVEYGNHRSFVHPDVLFLLFVCVLFRKAISRMVWNYWYKSQINVAKNPNRNINLELHPNSI